MQLAPEQATQALAYYAWRCGQLESIIGANAHAMDGLAARNKELEGQLQALTQVKNLYPESKPFSDAPADSEGGEAG